MVAKKRSGRKNKRRVDLDQMKKKLEKLGQSKFFKPEEGSNQIRVMPPFDDSGSFYVEACMHHQFQVDDMGRAFVCKDYHEVGPCPVCFYIEDLHESEKEDAASIMKRIAQRVKFNSNIYNYKKEVYQIWGYSAKLLRKILGYMTDPDWGDITDTAEGHDLVVDREGTGLKTKYDLRIKPKPKAFSDEFEKKIFDLNKELLEFNTDEEMIDAIESNYGDFDLTGWKKYKAAWYDENNAEEEEIDEEEEEDVDIDDMDRSELKEYIREYELDVKVFKSDNEDDIREKIRSAS